MAEAAQKSRGVRKEREGMVVGKSGDKTVMVEVERRTEHPLYGKIVRRKKRFQTHDERNEAQVGDKVRIAECRPMSRHKHWRLVAVIRHNA